MDAPCQHNLGCLAVSLLSDYICLGPPAHLWYTPARRGCLNPQGLQGWREGFASASCTLECTMACSAENLCGHRDIPGSCCSKGSRNNWITLQRSHGKAAGSQLFVCCWGATADPSSSSFALAGWGDHPEHCAGQSAGTKSYFSFGELECTTTDGSIFWRYSESWRGTLHEGQ